MSPGSIEKRCARTYSFVFFASLVVALLLSKRYGTLDARSNPVACWMLFSVGTLKNEVLHWIHRFGPGPGSGPTIRLPCQYPEVVSETETNQKSKQYIYTFGQQCWVLLLDAALRTHPFVDARWGLHSAAYHPTSHPNDGGCGSKIEWNDSLIYVRSFCFKWVWRGENSAERGLG